MVLRVHWRCTKDVCWSLGCLGRGCSEALGVLRVKLERTDVVTRGVKLIFSEGHISIRVALKGPHVMVRQYKCNQMQC